HAVGLVQPKPFILRSEGLPQFVGREHRHVFSGGHRPRMNVALQETQNDRVGADTTLERTSGGSEEILLVAGFQRVAAHLREPIEHLRVRLPARIHLHSDSSSKARATPMLVPKFLASHRSGHIPVGLGPGAPLSFPPPCPSRSTPAGRSFFRGSTISENKSVTHVLGQGGRTPARSVGSIPLPLPLGGRRLANTCESERSRAAAQLAVTNPTLSHVRTNVLDIANSR